jgi:molybdopterin-guanine dinucleotide biosynthesis protein B
VLVSSSNRWALMHELRGAGEPAFDDLIARLSPCDLVLVEGFKREPIPKLEVHRADNGADLLFPHDPHIVGIATDALPATRLPVFGLDEIERIADFLLQTARRIALPPPSLVRVSR